MDRRPCSSDVPSSKCAVDQTTLGSSELPVTTTSAPNAKNKKRKAAADYDALPEEKRARRFRTEPPLEFHDVYDRALSQRFYVLRRCPGGTADCPEETFELAGSTGNVYEVHIAQEPSCDCPHALKGNQCKHVFYILSKVLHAPYHLVYQKALLRSELREIFAAASRTTPCGNASDGRRKAVEGDCPICYCELEPENAEGLVWCRAARGQNFHETCFETWARTSTGASVTCPLCRSEWLGDPSMVSKVQMERAVLHEGYQHVLKLEILPLAPRTQMVIVRSRPA